MCTNMYGNLTCYDDATSRYVQAFFGSANAVLIVTGNSLALLIVYRTKALQDAAFCFLMNLALSDLLLGLISQPPSLYYAITCQWPWGRDGAYCQFVGFSICLLCSVSIISLALVSYERYSYTVHPFQHIDKFTFRRSLYACTVVWLYAGVASIFPVVGLWDGVGLQPYNALCNIQWEEEPLYLLAMILSVLFPAAALITFSYVRIIRVARKARKIDAIKNQITLGSSVSNRDCPLSVSGQCPDNDTYRGESDVSPIPDSNSPTEKPRPAREKTRAGRAKTKTKTKKTVRINRCTVTVSLLVGTFVLCWAPYVIVNTVHSIKCSYGSFWVTATAQWLCIFNSACNPMIYGITNRTFREGVRKFLRGLKFWQTY